MTFTSIKAAFLALIYGGFFGLSSYLMIVGYFFHHEKNIKLTLETDQTQAVWRAHDLLRTISIHNLSSLIGSPPTIVIEKKTPWPIILGSTSFGLIVGFMTYLRKNTPPHREEPVTTAIDPTPKSDTSL